ncbi:MAG: ThiF family adenylyltransferase [Sedimentisphaerales bacterium]|nr:ThiF family adenylyltransferase [Sedimentisphaerales bacterium]
MNYRFEPLPEQAVPNELIQMQDELGLATAPVAGYLIVLSKKIKLKALEVTIRTPLPIKPVASIQEEEKLWLILETRAPWCYSAREDFPKLHHVMREKGFPPRICYTDIEDDDWIVDKTFPDFIIRLRQWLADAAAGMLVKEDERYEPLWISASDGLIEFNEEDVLNNMESGKWRTHAFLRKIGGTKYLQIGDKYDEIVVDVFYQPKISQKVWDTIPSKVIDVVELGKDIGCDVSHIIEPFSKDSQTAIFLIIFGVKRPKSISGKENANEWIGCLFIRKKTNKGVLVGATKQEKKMKISPDKIWSVNCLPVRSRFTMELARMTSGWEKGCDKRVAIIGAGALGSTIIDQLVRGGLCKVFIVDNDILSPHNLARHQLRNSELGFKKAEGMAAYLNDLYDNETATVYPHKLFPIERHVLDELNNCKFVLDLSTSRAVQVSLGECRHQGYMKVPVVTGFMGAKGEVAFLLIDSFKKYINGNYLEAELIGMHQANSGVKKWLLSSKDVIEPGGGCRIVSSKVPWSLISLAGGWAGQNIAGLIQETETLRDIGRIGVFEVYKEGLSWNTKSIWLNVKEPTVFERSGWFIYLSANVEKIIKETCLEKDGCEACGILLGTINRARKIAFITTSWRGPTDSDAGENYCVRGREGLRIKLDNNLRDTGSQEVYLGEWHSHPKGSTVMSAIDLATSKEMAKRLIEFGLPAILVITNGNEIDAHVITEK